MTETIDQLLAKLDEHGQSHVLAFWDELSPQQQQGLRQQLEAIDLDELAALYRGDADSPDWAALSRSADPPTAVRLSELQSDGPTGIGVTRQDAIAAGVEALRSGKVAVLVTAGGQGSRLGFEKPKSLYPIGPISGASLAQIHIEKALAAAARYGTPVPVLFMTSPATHEDTVRFFEENNRFGLPEEDLIVFCQGTMPAVDAATGKLLLAEKDSLFLSPDGHGGTVAALEKSGALNKLRQRGVEQLFYLQVDNPIVPICDPEMIGYHILAGSELTSIAVAKETPQEKLGNFAMIDGRMQVIEYSDFPDDVAEKRDPDGGLTFWAGSIAVHVFGLAFLDRASAVKDTLPMHVAHKKVPHLDPAGNHVEPAEPNALKFERFIFDLVPHAANPIVVEYEEAECFAPLKNASGAPKDTPEYVRSFMIQQHRHWLEAAGAKVADSIDVEISPLWALDAQGVAEKAAALPPITEPTYLRD